MNTPLKIKRIRNQVLGRYILGSQILSTSCCFFGASSNNVLHVAYINSFMQAPRNIQNNKLEILHLDDKKCRDEQWWLLSSLNHGQMGATFPCPPQHFNKAPAKLRVVPTLAFADGSPLRMYRGMHSMYIITILTFYLFIIYILVQAVVREQVIYFN